MAGATGGHKRMGAELTPCDWEVRPLGPLVTITSGESPSLFSFGTDGTPYFKVDQLSNSTKYLSAKNTDYFICGPSKKVSPGSVVFAKRGAAIMLNRVRLLSEDGYMDTNMMSLTPGAEIESEYLFYILSHSKLSSVADVTSIPQINNKHIKPFVVPLPRLDEQRAISESLSDVDDLIGTLDTLVAKKRGIKKGAMQQLLTGKTRLLGFSSEWKRKRLGDLVAIRNTKVLPSRVDPETPCVELENIGQGDGRLLQFSKARDLASSKYRFHIGDVLFGRLRSYLRKFWLADRDGICTTEIWPLMVDQEQAVAGFLHALVQTERFIEAASISYGTHMPRADWAVIGNLEIRLPNTDEQAAIANVLSDTDAEIEALERRREKTKQIKQGMMQQLLTGRVRLHKAQDQKATT